MAEDAHLHSEERDWIAGEAIRHLGEGYGSKHKAVFSCYSKSWLTVMGTDLHLMNRNPAARDHVSHHI